MMRTFTIYIAIENRTVGVILEETILKQNLYMKVLKNSSTKEF